MAGACAVVGAVLAPTACAQVEESGAPDRSPVVVYVAAKLIPVGKTVRAAVADGSITPSELPGDVLADDRLDDPKAIDCLVMGSSVPAGTVLRRSMFVTPSSLGLPGGYTDGTTLDPDCS